MLKNRNTAVIIFIISIFVFTFYLFFHAIITDVYRIHFVGAIGEMLWLPMLVALLAIPIMSTLIFIKNRGRARLYSVLSVLFIISSIIVLVSEKV